MMFTSSVTFICGCQKTSHCGQENHTRGCGPWPSKARANGAYLNIELLLLCAPYFQHVWNKSGGYDRASADLTAVPLVVGRGQLESRG